MGAPNFEQIRRELKSCTTTNQLIKVQAGADDNYAAHLRYKYNRLYKGKFEKCLPDALRSLNRSEDTYWEEEYYGDLDLIYEQRRAK